MASVPPPQGMNEADYEAIEAAVTETVRGRWFLNEFARRNRAAELRQLLDAMTRLEGVVAAGHAPALANGAAQPALAPADPSVRLLMQRIKEIAGQLDMLSLDMREAGVDERFASAVEKEARAVSGMLRGKTLPGKTLPGRTPGEGRAPAPTIAAPNAPAPIVPTPIVPAPVVTLRAPPDDPRLAALLPLDELPLRDRLALFA